MKIINTFLDSNIIGHVEKSRGLQDIFFLTLVQPDKPGNRVKFTSKIPFNLYAVSLNISVTN